MNDPYSVEASRLRSVVQTSLREGSHPALTPYQQFLLCGWYERRLAELEARLGPAERQRDHLAGTVDTNYAARLEAEQESMRAVAALDRQVAPGFDEQGG